MFTNRVYVDNAYYTVTYTESSGITAQVKISDTWKNISCSVKIGGELKTVTSIKEKIGGVWK